MMHIVAAIVVENIIDSKHLHAQSPDFDRTIIPTRQPDQNFFQRPDQVLVLVLRKPLVP